MLFFHNVIKVSIDSHILEYHVIKNRYIYELPRSHESNMDSWPQPKHMDKWKHLMKKYKYRSSQNVTPCSKHDRNIPPYFVVKSFYRNLFLPWSTRSLATFLSVACFRSGFAPFLPHTPEPFCRLWRWSPSQQPSGARSWKCSDDPV